MEKQSPEAIIDDSYGALFFHHGSCFEANILTLKIRTTVREILQYQTFDTHAQKAHHT